MWNHFQNLFPNPTRDRDKIPGRMLCHAMVIYMDAFACLMAVTRRFYGGQQEYNNDIIAILYNVIYRWNKLDKKSVKNRYFELPVTRKH